MKQTNLTVQDWMSQPVEVAYPFTPVADAYDRMMNKGIRRLPVVDPSRDNTLVGIVTLGDLREARPSPATSLSIYELNYLIARLTIDHVMTHNPYTVTPGTSVQEAARIMMERKVSGLPVVDSANRPVGVITESDIFRMLIDQWDAFTAPRIVPALVPTLAVD